MGRPQAAAGNHMRGGGGKGEGELRLELGHSPGWKAPYRRRAGGALIQRKKELRNAGLDLASLPGTLAGKPIVECPAPLSPLAAGKPDAWVLVPFQPVLPDL